MSAGFCAVVVDVSAPVAEQVDMLVPQVQKQCLCKDIPKNRISLEAQTVDVDGSSGSGFLHVCGCARTADPAALFGVPVCEGVLRASGRGNHRGTNGATDMVSAAEAQLQVGLDRECLAVHD